MAKPKSSAKVVGLKGPKFGLARESGVIVEKVDLVNHPKHYTMGAIEPIDVIEDWNLGFSDGNALKYLARSQHKGTEILDIEKAVWYLQRHLTRLKKKADRQKALREFNDSLPGVSH